MLPFQLQTFLCSSRMKNTALLFALVFVQSSSCAQTQKPIWDIGTKWTYTFHWTFAPDEINDFAEVEIVDTTTIDGLKLYI